MIILKKIVKCVTDLLKKESSVGHTQQPQNKDRSKGVTNAYLIQQNDVSNYSEVKQVDNLIETKWTSVKLVV